jgi:hypothetical protein
VTNPTYEMKCGFFACLSTLNQRLAEMSHGANQWMSLVVPDVFLSVEGEPRSYVIIGRSIWDPSMLSSHLCFLLPLVALAGCRDNDAELLVRFSPWSTVPLSRGLYWHDGRLSYDPLEDFDLFWTPLKECLCPQRMEGYMECQELEPNWNGQTIDGVPFRKALAAHIIWLSQSKEAIEDAINE